jgi:hypothetical protein
MPRFADRNSPTAPQECARPGKPHEGSGSRRLWTGSIPWRAWAVWIIVAGLGGPGRAGAAEIAELVGRVSMDSYWSYLQNDLYAHTGDDRSCLGAQHELAMLRIQERFAGFGLTTTLGSPFVLYDRMYYNVIGIHEGTTCPGEIYLVGAHYDSAAGSPGAWDNASGVAGVLEAARVLSQASFEATIIFIAFDGEERGRKGSRAYAQEHALDDIRVMICLDGIAYRPYQRGEPDYERVGLYYVYPDANLLHDLSLSMESYGALTCVVTQEDLSDDMPFGQMGFAAASLIAQGLRRRPPFMHTPLDAVDTDNWIDYEYGTAVTRGVVGYLAEHARPVAAPVLPDFDGDGQVDYPDLMRLARSWLARDGCEEIDVSRDGRVDMNDFARFARLWRRGTPPGPAHRPIPDIPVAHWAFDEGMGDTAAESLGGGQARLYGAAWAPGIRGGAVSLDGVDDYVDCGDAGTLAPAQMTVTFWMRPEGGTQATQYVIAKALHMGIRRDYAVTYCRDGHVQFLFAQSEQDAVQLTSDATVTTGQWVHVAAVRDGSTALLYLNGARQGMQPYSFVPENKQYPLRIGVLVPLAPFGSFQGKVDDLRIYDQALTAEEVLRLYREESP